MSIGEATAPFGAALIDGQRIRSIGRHGRYALWGGYENMFALLDRSDGLVLMLLFGIFIYVTVGDIRKRREDPLVREAERIPLPSASIPDGRRDVITLMFGIVGLGIGGQLTVSNGASLANALGVSPVERASTSRNPLLWRGSMQPSPP